MTSHFSEQHVDASNFLEILEATLPDVQFHAYRSTANTDLYICGFLNDEVLIGGYTLTSEQRETLFVAHSLNLTLFFQSVWSGESPRFYPPDMEALYNAHRENVTLWQRLDI